MRPRSRLSRLQHDASSVRPNCPSAYEIRRSAWQPGRVSTWSDPAKVDEYTRRIGVVPQRLAGEAVLGEILPRAPQRALDLGCGDGRLAAVILDTRPGIEEIVAVDASPPMLERARSRFADEPRVKVQEWDLRESIRPLGTCDLVDWHLHRDAPPRCRARASSASLPARNRVKGDLRSGNRPG